MEPVYVPRSEEEKAMQRALLQYFQPEKQQLVRRALRFAGRGDLIGFGPECLVVPENRERRSDPEGAARGRSSGRAPAGVGRGQAGGTSASPALSGQGRGGLSPSEFWRAQRSRRAGIPEGEATDMERSGDRRASGGKKGSAGQPSQQRNKKRGVR